MVVVEQTKRFGAHHNAFGFLRLILASLVIVSHTAEMMDGNRSRELLTIIFHSISFGDLAVDGFFVISGFLITGSYLNSDGPYSYLKKRIARIFPAFIVASAICVLIVGPLGGGRPEHGVLRAIAGTTTRMAVLSMPVLANAFNGTPYPALNGASWTIQFEFLCYVLTLVLGVLGVFRYWWVIASGAIVLLLVNPLLPSAIGTRLDAFSFHGIFLPGGVTALTRLFGVFLAGSAFFLVQHRIPLKKKWVVVALVGLVGSLCNIRMAHLGCAVFGSYLLFTAAAWGGGHAVGRINDRNDISYGLYLYAWPIEKLLLWWGLSDSLVVLGTLSWVLAALAGTVSWFTIERPVIRLVRRR